MLAAVFFLHVAASVEATSNKDPEIYLRILALNVGRIQLFILRGPEAVFPVGNAAGP